MQDSGWKKSKVGKGHFEFIRVINFGDITHVELEKQVELILQKKPGNTGLISYKNKDGSYTFITTLLKEGV
jgi:hypothetical protein